MIVQCDTEMHSVDSICSIQALKLITTAACTQSLCVLLAMRRYTDL
jgi:hypothetical protein